MAITRQEVDAMYMDLFGRKAKDAGAQYWMDEVASGKIEASDLPRHLAYAANTTEKGRADLAYGTRLREEAEAQAAAQAEQELALQTAREAEASRQQEMIDLLREQQASQLLAQQRLQEQISTGIQGKGGTQQQQAQSAFGDAAPQPTQQTMQEPAMMTDIDTGGGYYRNPYSSGFGMGYQDPYAGMRYMPQRGLMGGASGFGGKGGYGSPMYSPYQYSPYGGMSPGKGGMSPRERASMPPEGYTQTIPDLPQDTPPADPIVGADGSAPYYRDTPTGPGYSEPLNDPEVDGGLAMYASPTTPSAQTMVGDAADLDVPAPTQPEMITMEEQVFDTRRPRYQPMYQPMYRPMYPMYGGKGGYYR